MIGNAKQAHDTMQGLMRMLIKIRELPEVVSA
jgi:hypothetical protein